MSEDPLVALQNPARAAYAASLDGHRCLATGSYTDAEVPVLSLALLGDDPLEATGTGEDGAFTIHLEAWCDPDGNTVIVVTDTGDEPGELNESAEDLIADLEALLGQALKGSISVTAMYSVEYEGQPTLIWKDTP